MTIRFAMFMMFVVAAACLPATALTAAEPEVLELWPGKAPDEAGEFGEEKVTSPGGPNSIMRVTDVTRPAIHIYKPAADKNNGAALIIAPGGGYSILAWEHEGTEVAEWANKIGMTGIVLKYRVPRRPGQPKDQPPLQPLQDAQRAVSLVRSRASQWGIDPARIGILGFSAGGNLAANATTNYAKRAYQPVDAADQVSCRPDFSVLIYPAYLFDASTGRLNPAYPVTKETPPTFCAHAGDDKLTAEGSVMFYLAQKQLGIPGELHVYAKGGHGFGIRGKGPTAAWPVELEQWLASLKLLEAAK